MPDARPQGGSTAVALYDQFGNPLLSAAGGIKVDNVTAFNSAIDSVSIQSARATYRVVGLLDSIGANGGFLTTSTGPLFLLVGSATRIVRVPRIQIGGAATANSTVEFKVSHYSTIATGGTSAAGSFSKVDDADGPATSAGIVGFTGSGGYTPGTLVGAVSQKAVFLPAKAAPPAIGPIMVDMVDPINDDKLLTLRDGNHVVAVELAIASGLGTQAAGYRIFILFTITESLT